jgi:uncharacterized protein (TIGR00730 family)
VRSVCVFCGSNSGTVQAYTAAAHAMGRAIAARGLQLVYGGGSVGLMGTVADAALGAGGEAVGVLPRLLFRSEVMHTGLTALHDVGSMHERKALMAELSDAFVALPGGFGTLDELFEMTTWIQLKLSRRKPVGILDIDGYFAPLRAFIERGVRDGFIPAREGAWIAYDTDAGALLDRLAAAASDVEERPTEP